MSGRLLIVDAVSTSRIVLKVTLAAAQHDVVPVACVDEAHEELERTLPDMVIVNLADGDDGVLGFCEAVSQRTDRDIAVIAVNTPNRSDLRLKALAAGVDDVLNQPVPDNLLLARIRSLLRARDASAELRLREDTRRALGFAEDTSFFQPMGSIVAVTERPAFAADAEAALARHGATDVTVSPRQGLFAQLPARPDAFIVDAAAGGEVEEVFRLLAELRSRADTRHAAIIVALSYDAGDLAALALDLGANDILMAGASPEEIGYRVAAQMKRKLMQDRLRETLRDGLEAAVTDPLTGLFNRRYALSHLERMAEKARESGKPVATMVLDIDHFKSINDRFGHATGDLILSAVAERLKENLRAVDLLARIGGEEFLVALPDASHEQALGAAKRLCRLISREAFKDHTGAHDVPVTLSIGVAIGTDGPAGPEAVHALFNDADQALYRAKRAGRNTVTLAGHAA